MNNMQNWLTIINNQRQKFSNFLELLTLKSYFETRSRKSNTRFPFNNMESTLWTAIPELILVTIKRYYVRFAKIFKLTKARFLLLNSLGKFLWLFILKNKVENISQTFSASFRKNPVTCNSVSLTIKLQSSWCLKSRKRRVCQKTVSVLNEVCMKLWSRKWPPCSAPGAPRLTLR